MRPHAAYIHIPFCVKKCAYCDFLSFPSCLERIDEYVSALCREIELSKTLLRADGETLDSVYFGGGTPSLLTPAQLERVLTALQKHFRLAVPCEITLEANPGTVGEEKLKNFRELGINRLSIGVQSLDDSVLRTLGRIHDAEAAKAAVLSAKRAGFQNISCDMMLGIPGQTKESLEKTLSFFLSEKIPHISLYSLILEEGTPLYARYNGDIEKYVSQEEDRGMYHYVLSTLSASGYAHYEISNVAIPGFESRHNMMYWRAEPYYAFGCGAHYYLGNERGRHEEDLDRYIASVNSDRPAKEKIYIPEELLDDEARKKEFMMLAFRTGSGVDEGDFEARFHIPVESAFGAELEKEIRAGLVEKTDYGYRLTEKGFDLANQVFLDYI